MGKKRRDRGARRYQLADGHVVVCAWCERERRDDEWQARGPSPDQSQLSHGICPECLEQQIARIAGGGRLARA